MIWFPMEYPSVLQGLRSLEKDALRAMQGVDAEQTAVSVKIVICDVLDVCDPHPSSACLSCPMALCHEAKSFFSD